MKSTEASPMLANDFTRTNNILRSTKILAMIIIGIVVLCVFGGPVVGMPATIEITTYASAVAAGCILALFCLEGYGIDLNRQWHQERLTVSSVVFEENHAGQRVANVTFYGEAALTVIPYKASYSEAFNDLHHDQNLTVVRRTNGFTARHYEGRLA